MGTRKTPRTFTMACLCIGLQGLHPAAAQAAETALWAGHQVVWGTAKVPVLGARPTRTDSYVLASVERHGADLHLAQRTCKVAMQPVAGVRTALLPHAAPRLPKVSFVLAGDAGGDGYQGAWDAVWTQHDHDGDGKPGVTVAVDVPLCRGSVYVAMQSRSAARATRFGDDLLGEVEVDLAQTVLGASNACLRLTAGPVADHLRGVFRYTQVPPDATCADLQGVAWPEAALPD